jgi:hypothetical protein
MLNRLSRLILMFVIFGLTVFGTVSCVSDGPFAQARSANVTMSVLAPTTIRAIIVEVTGPGIDPAIVANFPVGLDSIATGTLSISAGAARRIVITAMDTSGIVTHRADTTITLIAGTNPTLQMWLEPVVGTFGITVSFGGVKVVVPDTTTRNATVGDVAIIDAYAVRANGDTVPATSLVWGSNNLAVATVQQGTVTYHKAGEAVITVSFQGASAAVRTVASEAPPAPDGILVDTISK